MNTRRKVKRRRGSPWGRARAVLLERDRVERSARAFSEGMHHAAALTVELEGLNALPREIVEVTSLRIAQMAELIATDDAQAAEVIVRLARIGYALSQR